jgi:hypothetical protein
VSHSDPSLQEATLISSKIDLVQLVVTQQLSLWFRDLEDSMSHPGSGSAEDEMEEGFALYRKAQKIIQLGNAFARYVA